MNVQLETTAVLEVFHRAIQGWDGISVRKMFGFPCAFHNDQMFLYVYHDGLVLRLSETDRADCVAQTGAAPFAPKGGRGMREYLVMPEDLVNDSRKLEPWIARAFAFVDAMPPKQKSRRKRRS